MAYYAECCAATIDKHRDQFFPENKSVSGEKHAVQEATYEHEVLGCSTDGIGQQW